MDASIPIKGRPMFPSHPQLVRWYTWLCCCVCECMLSIYLILFLSLNDNRTGDDVEEEFEATTVGTSSISESPEWISSISMPVPVPESVLIVCGYQCQELKLAPISSWMYTYLMRFRRHDISTGSAQWSRQAKGVKVRYTLLSKAAWIALLRFCWHKWSLCTQFSFAISPWVLVSAHGITLESLWASARKSEIASSPALPAPHAPRCRVGDSQYLPTLELGVQSLQGKINRKPQVLACVKIMRFFYPPLTPKSGFHAHLDIDAHTTSAHIIVKKTHQRWHNCIHLFRDI